MEEKFGFNKTTISTLISDTIKGLGLALVTPNGKQLVVYRVTTLLFPGKQLIVCLKRETTLSGSEIVGVENITDGRFVR